MSKTIPMQSVGIISPKSTEVVRRIQEFYKIQVRYHLDTFKNRFFFFYSRVTVWAGHCSNSVVLIEGVCQGWIDMAILEKLILYKQRMNLTRVAWDHHHAHV